LYIGTAREYGNLVGQYLTEQDVKRFVGRVRESKRKRLDISEASMRLLLPRVNARLEYELNVPCGRTPDEIADARFEIEIQYGLMDKLVREYADEIERIRLDELYVKKHP